MVETKAPKKRRRLPWYWRIMIYVLAIYLLYLGLMFFFQHKLIFPAYAAGSAQPNPIHTATQVLEIETSQGTSVAWFIPAPDANAGNPAPMVVFLHGNAELIDHQYAIVDLYHAQGISVLLPEFRGYGGAGGSDGSPSQAHIVADVVAFYDLAIALPQVDAQRIVIHGRSIGGGVATQLADQRDCNALIVESTSASVAAMAWRYGVPPFIVRSPFHSARVFRGLDLPILILHGQHDEIFNYTHGQALLAAASNGTLVPFDCGHEVPGSQVERYNTVIVNHLQNAGVIEQSQDDLDF